MLGCDTGNISPVSTDDGKSIIEPKSPSKKLQYAYQQTPSPTTS